MVNLDIKSIRYLSQDDFRVLTAVEMGSKNHELVPTSLISQISKLKGNNEQRCISELARNGLISKVKNAKYDGYRLTYAGYDYLALKSFSKREYIYSIGNKIGVGKESDVYVVSDKTGKQMVLKIHRHSFFIIFLYKNNFYI